MIATAPIRSWLARVSRFIGGSFLRAAQRLARADRNGGSDGAADPLAALRLRYPDAPAQWLEAIADRMQSQLDSVTPPAADLVALNRDAARRTAIDTAASASPEAGADRAGARDARHGRTESGTGVVAPRMPRPAVFSWPSRPMPKSRPVFVACQAPVKTPPAPPAMGPDRKTAPRPKVVFETAPSRRPIAPTSRLPDSPSAHRESAAPAIREVFTNDVPAVTKIASGDTPLPPAHVAPRARPEPLPSPHGEVRRVAAPDARAAITSRKYSDKGDPTPWLDGREPVTPRVSFVEMTSAPVPIQSSLFGAVDATSSDRWPELPAIDVGSEQARRLSDIVEERSRIERLKSDQTERLWNG